MIYLQARVLVNTSALLLVTAVLNLPAKSSATWLSLRCHFAYESLVETFGELSEGGTDIWHPHWHPTLASGTGVWHPVSGLAPGSLASAHWRLLAGACSLASAHWRLDWRLRNGVRHWRLRTDVRHWRLRTHVCAMAPVTTAGAAWRLATRGAPTAAGRRLSRPAAAAACRRCNSRPPRAPKPHLSLPP